MVKLLFRRGWAALGTLLLAILFAAGYAASFGPSRMESGCPRSPPGIEAELNVLLEKRGLVEPRATVSMLVDVPDNNGLAWDLLHNTRDDDQHKQALRCVLGMPGQIWNRQPPSVTKEGDRIIVRAKTYEFVPLTVDGSADAGALTIYTLGPQRWQATIAEPAYLSLARWREVSVSAPAGWLSDSKPYVSLPAEAHLIRWERLASDASGVATERIRWERPALDTASETSSLAGFTIHPDVRTQIASTSQTRPWIWGSDVLYNLSTLLLVGTLVLWAHRARALLVRRMCLPILAIAAMLTADWLIYDYANDFTYWLVFLVLTPLVMLAVSAAWGVRWRIWLPIGLEVLVAYGFFIAATTTTETQAPLVEPRLAVAAWTFVVLQLVVVLAAAIINAARVLLSREPEVQPPVWVWWCGVACAAVLVLEHFANTHGYFVNPWNDSQPLQANVALFAIVLYPWGVLNSAAIFLSVLALIGVWALIRKRVEDGLSIEDRYVILLFLMGPVIWTVAPFGLSLPVWPLALLVLWLWLRDKRTLLNTPLAQPGSTVRTVIEDHGPDQLRAAAAQWGWIRQRGRALDRDLAKGTITLDVHTEETRKLLDIHPLPNASAETVRQLRAETITPVDMVLAMGPGATPWENAKWGAKIAAVASIPAAALSLWLQWHTSAPRDPLPWSSAILEWLGTVALEVTAWLSAGAVLGLLWQRLRFSRGIGKALPLVTAYAAAQIAEFAATELTGGNSTALINIALFTVVTTLTALSMDMRALRTSDTWWSRRRHALAAAYGMENLSTQVAFVVAQTVALITIVNAIHTGIADHSDKAPSQAPTPPAVVRNQ